MTDEASNPILTMLRAMRGDIGALRDDVRQIKMRLTNLEHGQAHYATVLAQIQLSIDRHGERFHRIEQRPGLVDQPE